MLDLVSNVNGGIAAVRVGLGHSLCPTQPHLVGGGETVKTCAEWVLVSPVSPVSPNLQLIEEYRMGKQERQRQGLVAALPRALRQVRPVQQPCGFQGETTMVEHG
jgi:hypothetical protein